MAIFTPSNFRADWYGWATNQFSHAAIGCGSSAFAAMAWLHFWGEYPYQSTLFWMVVGFFALTELSQRPFKFWDSMEDLMFYGYGAAIACYGFRERERFDPGLDPDFGMMLTVFGFFALHQTIGIVIRKIQERRLDRDSDSRSSQRS